MSAQLPPEDQPPAQWRRMVGEEEAEAAIPRPDPDDPFADPFTVATMFCDALEDPGHYRTALLELTTPESHAAWGDFSAASADLLSIKDRGYGSVVDPALGDSDVRYLKILRGVSQSFQVLDTQPILVAATVTVVWRLQLRRWLVHAYGVQVLPEDVPHG